jgi:hypothetical protein
MAKKRLDADEAFKNIMGQSSNAEIKKEEIKAPVKTEASQESKKEQAKEKLIQTAFYITAEQHKAMKIKAALKEKPEDKDLSSIVRAALDIYLADTIKDFK